MSEIELNEEYLDYIFVQLENFMVFIEQDLGSFPYIEVMASLFMFASIIAKTNKLFQKDFLLLAKKIYKEAEIEPPINKMDLN